MKLNARVEIRLSASGASRGLYIDNELHRPLNDLEENLVVRMEKQRQALIDAGICPDCLQSPRHHYGEPLSTCACGTGEDYGERPMQRLQRLEAALPDEESLQTLADLVSIGGQKAEEVMTRGPRSWDLLKPDRLRYLATAGYSRAFDVIKKLKETYG